jgi:hypothetical protein
VKLSPSHERKLRDLHYSTINRDSRDKNKGNEAVGQVKSMGEKRNAYRVLVSKAEGMIHLKDLKRVILK